jgi:hypothetical protein
MQRRRLLLWLATIPATGPLWFGSRNKLVVTNESGQTLHGLSVEVCDRIFALGDLASGNSASARFGPPADESGFVVRARLADGTSIEESCGYVVWEDYARRFHIAIRAGGRVDCT